MIGLELSDIHVGILIELYCNGHQKSRTTPTIHEEIEYLIGAGLIEEFQRDMIWWGMTWMAKISEKGVDTLKLEIDPLRVFDLLLYVAESPVEAVCEWVMMFNLSQLPVAFANPDEQIREAAERMAINAPVQGTSADIIKIAMINVYNEMKKRKISTDSVLVGCNLM